MQWSKDKDQKTNNDLQNTSQKTKDWATQTPLKTRDEHMCSVRLSSSCSTSGIVLLLLSATHHCYYGYRTGQHYM
jgi:hypothetical protein